jgi:hypothetical protein
MKSGNLNFLEPSGPPRPVMGLLYLLLTEIPKLLCRYVCTCIYVYILLLLLQSALQPWWVSACLTVVEHFSRKVLQSAVDSGTSNPKLGGEPGI